jgi:hypothetical protein
VIALVGALLTCKSAKPSALSPETERAVKYFVGRGERVDPIVLLFLEGLRRRHHLTALDPLAAQLKHPRIDPAHPDKELALHLRLYARLVDPSAAPSADELAMASNDFDRLAMETMYCDRNGVGVGLEKRLLALAERSGYALTHAAMYAGWARENGCLETGAPLFNALADKLVAFITGADGPTDVAMEATALLLALGERKRVPPRWIVEVKRAQRSDGGWTHGPVGPTNDHSSLFGLWVLIESERTENLAMPRLAH